MRFIKAKITNLFEKVSDVKRILDGIVENNKEARNEILGLNTKIDEVEKTIIKENKDLVAEIKELKNIIKELSAKKAPVKKK